MWRSASSCKRLSTTLHVRIHIAKPPSTLPSMQGILRTPNYSRALGPARGFATSSARQANRAVVYNAPGAPKSVLSVVTYPDLPSPPAQSLNVRYILSPVNPSDINVVEGVYPAKPTLTDALVPGHKLERPVYVGGNEGLAEVTEVGSGVQGVRKGDWVVMAGQQLGTWSSARTLKAEDVIKVPSGLSEVNGATMTVRSPGNMKKKGHAVIFVTG